jgi:hypothetical protein
MAQSFGVIFGQYETLRLILLDVTADNQEVRNEMGWVPAQTHSIALRQCLYLESEYR